jgi:hypothetical protein
MWHLTVIQSWEFVSIGMVSAIVIVLLTQIIVSNYIARRNWK